jgi:hypothetical protein
MQRQLARYLRSFANSTSAISAPSTAAAAASSSAVTPLISASSSSAAAAATAAIPASIVVRSPIATQTMGDFSPLPTDVIRSVLAPMLDVRSLSRLDRTCRRMHATLSLFQSSPGPLLLQRLAHYLVVEPNPEKVKAIIKANPQLLRAKIKEVSVNGVSIRGYTPFQLAYGAGDVKAKEGEVGMCEALEEELTRHLGSKAAAIAEIQRQIAEKKLNVVDEVKDKEISDTLDTALKSVIQAITNEPFNRGRDANKKLILDDATLLAIATFRSALDELQPKIVEEGMHFRSKTLQETLDAYAQAARTWRYATNQCILFADGVLSSVLLSCLPVNDKQRFFGQGYYHLYGEHNSKEPFARRMTVRGTNINFDDCLRGSSEFSDLSGSYIDIAGGRDGDMRLGGGGARPATGPAIFKAYVEQKQRACKTYAAEQPRACGPASRLVK